MSAIKLKSYENTEKLTPNFLRFLLFKTSVMIAIKIRMFV